MAILSDAFCSDRLVFVLCQTVKQFLSSSVVTVAQLAFHTSTALVGEKTVSPKGFKEEAA